MLDPYNSVSARDTGLPVPALKELYPAGSTTPSGPLVADQQAMPGVAKPPQAFGRFDDRLPLFVGFPFGYGPTNLNWFAADGISLELVDDAGTEYAYPLMSFQAKAGKGKATYIVGFDTGCTTAGSKRSRTPFNVVSPSEDPRPNTTLVQATSRPRTPTL